MKTKIVKGLIIVAELLLIGATYKVSDKIAGKIGSFMTKVIKK